MSANTKIKMNDIDNTKLEEAMHTYLQAPGRETLLELVLAIKETKLFVPARVMPEKGGYQPYVIQNKEKDMYMPAFTSQDKFPPDRRYQGMLKLQYKQCVSLLLDNPTLIQGIALNPFHESVLLKTKMLELSRQVEEKEAEFKRTHKAVQVKADDFRMITRHTVEFHQISKQLFERKLDFIQELTEEVLCELYKFPYTEIGQESHFDYSPKDFEIMELNVRDDLNIMQIIAPKKHLLKTNCRELYIVWNPQTERVGYYVIEKGTDPEKKEFFLVEVKKDDTWERLEDAPAEGSGLSRVMELFEEGQEETFQKEPGQD